MSKNAQVKVKAEPDPFVLSGGQDALDELQTKIQILLDDFTDVASVDLTKGTVVEMKQMAQNLSRVIMQVEALLRQT